MRCLVVGVIALLLLASCADDPTVGASPATPTATEVATPTQVATPTEVATEPDSAAPNDGLFPTVVDVSASSADGASWRFSVTLLSEYDTPQRYADAWRVLDADDNELGIRVLAHDHANEQPFTRSHTIEVPADVSVVFVEGRDQLNGWSGERFAVTLQR